MVEVLASLAQLAVVLGTGGVLALALVGLLGFAALVWAAT